MNDETGRLNDETKSVNAETRVPNDETAIRFRINGKIRRPVPGTADVSFHHVFRADFVIQPAFFQQDLLFFRDALEKKPDPLPAGEIMGG